MRRVAEDLISAILPEIRMYSRYTSTDLPSNGLIYIAHEMAKVEAAFVRSMLRTRKSKSSRGFGRLCLTHHLDAAALDDTCSGGQDF